jgi:CubicO group peptidase (beta-lactamase class C family)
MFKMSGRTRRRPRRVATIVFITSSCVHVFGAARAAEPSEAVASEGTEPPQAAIIREIASEAMTQYHLKSIVVQVRSQGKDIYTGALGESMTGVPATPAMHFRNGAMAFTYLATMLLELVDQQPGNVALDDKLAKFLPEIPNADAVSLKNLANMTSGYEDYVYQPELLEGVYRNPFRQWTSEELIQIGVSKPIWFEPGKNWAYSHTNYVILGRVLEKITGMPLAEAMQKYIFTPMDLKQTQSDGTPRSPNPCCTHSAQSAARTCAYPSMHRSTKNRLSGIPHGLPPKELFRPPTSLI